VESFNKLRQNRPFEELENEIIRKMREELQTGED
jgi:hypothetical protein